MAAPMQNIMRLEIRQITLLSRCLRATINADQRSELARNSHTRSYSQLNRNLNFCQCRQFSSSHFVQSSIGDSKTSKLACKISRNKPFSTSPAAQYADEDESSELVEKINTDIVHHNTGRLFAIIHLQGKQRKVTINDLVLMKYHLEADVGEKIQLNKVLLVGSKDFTIIGRPLLSPNQVRVEAMVIEKTLSPTQISFLYKRRKNWKRMWLDRYRFTILRITDIQIAPADT